MWYQSVLSGIIILIDTVIKDEDGVVFTSMEGEGKIFTFQSCLPVEPVGLAGRLSFFVELMSVCLGKYPRDIWLFYFEREGKALKKSGKHFST